MKFNIGKVEIEFFPKDSKPISRHPRHILVIADEPHILRLIEVNLKRQGWGVTGVSNKEDAFTEVQRCGPDLIVLDTMLGGQNGKECASPDAYEVIKFVKNGRYTRTIPFIYVNPGNKRVKQFHEGWVTGYDCFLCKPFNPMELIAFVKRIFKELVYEPGEVIY
jgi:two-component system alkaline phosphatase synthesis response regulator PhoP